MFQDQKPKERFSIEGSHPSFAIAIAEKDVKALKKSIRKHGMPWDFKAINVDDGVALDPWLWAARCESFDCLEYLAAIAKEHQREIELMNCHKFVEHLLGTGQAPSKTQLLVNAIVRGMEKGAKKPGATALPFCSPAYSATARAVIEAFANLPGANPASVDGRHDSVLRAACSAIPNDDFQAMDMRLDECRHEWSSWTYEIRRSVFSIVALISIWTLSPNCFRRALIALTQEGLNEKGESDLLGELKRIGPIFTLDCFASGEGKFFFDELDEALSKCFSMSLKLAEEAVDEMSGTPESAVFNRKILTCAQAVLANHLRMELEEEISLPAFRAHATASAAARL